MASTRRALVKRYVAVIHRLRFLIDVVWALALICGAIWGKTFVGETVSKFPAPTDSLAERAEIAFQHYFPEVYDLRLNVLVLQGRDGTTLMTQPPLNTTMALFSAEYSTAIQTRFQQYQVVVLPYYTLVNVVPELAQQLVSPDEKVALIMIKYDQPPTADGLDDLLTSFLSEARSLLRKHGLDQQVEVAQAGMEEILMDVGKGVEKDAVHMDAMILPLAFLLLACVVRSLPLMVVPLLAVPLAVLTEFVVMIPIAKALDVIAYAPPLMISLTLALSIDYTLFQTTRFMDGLGLGLSLYDAVELMVYSAGYTILVSGCTLCVAFLGLTALPMAVLRTMGVGSAVAVAVVMLVNLTFVPALLFSAGPWLIKAHERLTRWCKVVKRMIKRCVCRGNGRSHETISEGLEMQEEDEVKDERTDTESGVLEDSDNWKRSEADSTHVKRPAGDGWAAIARFLARRRWHSWLVIALVVGACMPVMLQALRLRTSVDITLMLPHGSGSYHALEVVASHWGGTGRAFPYNLILVDEGSQLPSGFISPVGYQAMTTAVQALLQTGPIVQLEDFTGLVAVGGHLITYTQMRDALASNPAIGTLGFTLKQLAGGAVKVLSADGKATVLTFTTQTDPFGRAGQRWLEHARAALAHAQQAIEAETGVSVDLHLEGQSAVMHDAVEKTLGAFPLMAGILFAVLVVLICLSFRSLVAPLRSLLTIALTLAFAYGATVLVYQDGILDWTGARSLSKVGSVSWLPVVACFSIITGLALDYDVFLVSRVLEYRLQRHTDHDALARAMQSTGSIITAAGVIMAVAFSGLLLSSAMILNQLGFLLSISVLLDTLIVRTFLVPALITITGAYTWWPRRELYHAPPSSTHTHDALKEEGGSGHDGCGGWGGWWRSRGEERASDGCARTSVAGGERGREKQKEDADSARTNTHTHTHTHTHSDGGVSSIIDIPFPHLSPAHGNNGTSFANHHQRCRQA